MAQKARGVCMAQRSHVLADELSTHIRERILAGEYLPGASITETGIAAEYGVARPSARSALDRLASEDLLVRHAHAALRVRHVEATELPEILALLSYFEKRAFAYIDGRDVDLRPLRAAADESAHMYFHTLVCASGAERLIRFHRQTTFALILGTNATGAGQAEPPRAEMRDMTDALFRGDRAAAERIFRGLQEWRHAAVAPAHSGMYT